MEILNNYIYEREGNDCLITDAITLIRITYRAYIVTHTKDVFGGWTGNPIETNCQSFHDYKEAKTYYNKLYKQIKK